MYILKQKLSLLGKRKSFYKNSRKELRNSVCLLVPINGRANIKLSVLKRSSPGEKDKFSELGKRRCSY